MEDKIIGSDDIIFIISETDGRFFVTLVKNAFRNGGQDAMEYEYEESFATGEEATKWADDNLQEILKEME
jgi:division protein CdvB (Snf7/Vps24/ESCRT-III family)